MFIWNFWPGQQGGAERQCWKQAQEVVRQGCECVVLARWSRWRAPRRETCNGVLIRRVGIMGPVYETVWRMKRALKRMLKREQADAEKTNTAPLEPPRENHSTDSPGYGLHFVMRYVEYLFFMAESWLYLWMHWKSIDIIHVHGTCWMPGFSIRFARRRGIPVVSKETLLPVLTGVTPEIPFHKTWDRLRREIDAYIAINEEIRDALAPQVSADARIFTVPNGVEIPPEQASLKGRNVLLVANYVQGAEHKAFDVLLEAWARVVRAVPDARLTLVGRGNSAPWEEYARNLGCGDTVSFDGPTADVDAYYRTTDVFVLPSRREGLSNALLEAHAWGLPAVVSDIPGNRAVVRDGETGQVVPVGDAEALAGNIVSLLLDRTRLERMGTAARRRIELVFSMETVGRQLIEIYRGLLGERTGSVHRAAPVKQG
jgi:glycosyltransferase involved in cell wall biosynthesis